MHLPTKLPDSSSRSHDPQNQPSQRKTSWQLGAFGQEFWESKGWKVSW